jgi:hypothetical protein
MKFSNFGKGVNGKYLFFIELERLRLIIELYIEKARAIKNPLQPVRRSQEQSRLPEIIRFHYCLSRAVDRSDQYFDIAPSRRSLRINRESRERI